MHSGREAFKCTLLPLSFRPWPVFVFTPGLPVKTAEGHEILSAETERLGGCVFVCCWLGLFFSLFMSDRRGEKKRESDREGESEGEREWRGRSRREIRDLRCPVNTLGSNWRQSRFSVIDLARCPRWHNPCTCTVFITKQCAEPRTHVGVFLSLALVTRTFLERLLAETG